MDASRRLVIVSLLGMGAGLAGCAEEAPPATLASEAQGVVDGAVMAVRTIMAVRTMKTSTGFATSGLLGRARGVVIVPRALKVALIAGGSGGRAVLVGRTPKGWSDPAFYTVGSGSLGPQVGVRESTIVVLLMTERALDAFLRQSNVTLGADANLTVGQFNTSGAAAIGDQDVVVWTDAQGLFIGGSVAGQGFNQDADYNRAYYGRNVPAIDVLAGLVHNPAAGRLRAVL